MNFGDLSLNANGIIYPLDGNDASDMGYLLRGDNLICINFKGELYCYGGDCTYYDGILNNFGFTLPAKDPSDGYTYDYFLDGSSKIKRLFVEFDSFGVGGYGTHHAGGANGIELGDRMIKFNNLVFPSDDSQYPIFNLVYYTENGYDFFNNGGGAALSENPATDPTSLLWNWKTESGSVRFVLPRVCQTLFDSKGKPIKSSSYFEQNKDLSGKPVYYDNRPIANNETLYVYIYGQQCDIWPVGGTGVMVAKVKVYEDGIWLNRDSTETGTGNPDPIMNASDWDFFTGTRFVNDLQQATTITYLGDQWTCEVQYSPHHSKFILVRTFTTPHNFPDGWDDDSTSKITIAESDSPIGPFVNEKVLITTDYNTDLRMADDCSIVGIEKNKIIVSQTFALAEQTVNYNKDLEGYGSYFGSIPIS